eukprot:COSAG06_NODE_1793_length_8391_cov_49.730134_4_plen_90_part_00
MTPVQNSQDMVRGVWPRALRALIPLFLELHVQSHTTPTKSPRIIQLHTLVLSARRASRAVRSWGSGGGAGLGGRAFGPSQSAESLPLGQ